MRIFWVIAASFLAAAPAQGQGTHLSPCGGLQGIGCEEGLICRRDTTYPEAPGTCLKPGEATPRSENPVPGTSPLRPMILRPEVQERIKDGTFENTIRERQKEFRQDVRAARTALQEEIDRQGDKLQADLADIRDERKKRAVERIASSIQKLNDGRMEHFVGVLEKVELIQVGVLKKAAAAQEAGGDARAVMRELDFGYRALAVAREAILEQAKKIYAVPVGDEGTLKADVSAARAALRSDLKFVEARVKTSHAAARGAVLELGRIAPLESGGERSSP